MASVPKFYLNNPQELLPMIRQRSQGAFAGARTKLRESLANAGLLGNAGAYTDSLTQLNIAQGQDISQSETGFLTDVYKQERGAQLEFEIQRWIEEERKKQALMQSLFSGVGALAGGVGSYLGGVSSGKKISQALSKLG